MEITEAIKKVRTEKPKENFMIFEFSYNNSFVIPHKDGVALLAALATAEKLVDGYGEKKRITELERGQYTSRLMPYQEYERYKIAALLNITPDEVKEAMEALNNPTPSPTPTP